MKFEVAGAHALPVTEERCILCELLMISRETRVGIADRSKVSVTSSFDEPKWGLLLKKKKPEQAAYTCSVNCGGNYVKTVRRKCTDSQNPNINSKSMRQNNNAVKRVQDYSVQHTNYD